MTSIDLPDSVITWETEETHDFKNSYVATFTVRAVVGSVVIFERKYQDDDNAFWADGHAHDLADAKEKAANLLGERLAQLLTEEAA